MGDRSVTVRQQLESLKLRDASGAPALPALLQEEADLSGRLDALLWVLEDFNDATRGRGGDMSGPHQLNHERLYYWQRNRNIRAASWEITALLEMDGAYLKELTAPLEENNEESRDG